jgi:DNA polymerase III delta prime subunit
MTSHVLFDDLLTSANVIDALKHLSLQANPPHLLLSGPTGCGKTASHQLVCRQVLGPSWRSTTHILQARDLDKTSGAMAKFEAFLRPEGAGSEDTLAGRTSLDAFDHNISASLSTSPPPAGEESSSPEAGNFAAVSRIIIIEDADYLGRARQSYLRRMMEESSRSARFIFTTHTPSRMIEALRSRVQHVRIPTLSRVMIEQRLNTILGKEGHDSALGLVGDVAHVANGNLRKAIFMIQLLAQRDLLNDRKNVQTLMANTSLREVQLILEEALRGRVHDWRWEKKGEKNSRVLKGAMGALDQMMNAHDMDSREVVDRFHRFLTAGRSHFDPKLLTALLNAVSRCDMRLQRSAQQRIQLEELLHRIAEIGQEHLGPSASQAS